LANGGSWSFVWRAFGPPLLREETIASLAEERIDITSRIAAVDGLRGMLALVVLAWHACGPLGAAWLLVPANLAVSIFFILSGYALTRGWDGRFGVFLMRRFVRLWPVYALCLGVGYVIAGVHPVWSEFLWYPIIDANAKPSIDPPIWSLFLEAWMMPFMPLIVWAGSNTPARMALCMTVLLIASIAAPQISIAALFIAGAFLARRRFRNRFLESAVPQWLGKVSYSLYLTHWLVLALATRALGPWGAIAALPIVFATAWLVWWGVERLSIQMSQRIVRIGRGRANFPPTWRHRDAWNTPVMPDGERFQRDEAPVA
jgi:peptidoglycan/LPS O-acetylase OafA/YrhL